MDIAGWCIVVELLKTPGCERLAEWAAIGPVQRAAVQTLIDAVAERSARLIELAAGDNVEAYDHPGTYYALLEAAAIVRLGNK